VYRSAEIWTALCNKWLMEASEGVDLFVMGEIPTGRDVRAGYSTGGGGVSSLRA